MPSLSLNIGLNNGRKLPFGGGGGPPPSGLPTATTNTITLQSGGTQFGISDGAQFPKVSIGYFGDSGDFKLVWSGSRWEVRGEDNYVAYYNTTASQTTNYFPDQGNWFNAFDQSASLIFVGS